MEPKMKSWFLSWIPITITCAILFVGMLVIGGQAHGEERVLTSRQKLLDQISESSVIVLQDPDSGNETMLLWKVDRTSSVCPCDVFISPIGEGISMTISSVGLDIKFVFLSSNAGKIATIRMDNGTPNSADLTKEETATLVKLAKDVLDIALKKLKIASDEELEKVIKELLIYKGAMET